MAAAVVAAISFLLNELRSRRAETPLTDDEIRAALLRLEAILRRWHHHATRTNDAARRLDAAERDKAARSDLIVFGQSNTAFGVGFGLPALHDGALASLIRIYAPNLHKLSAQMSERIDVVQSAITWAGDSEHKLNGDERQELLQQLESTQCGLHHAADEVVEFIRDAFPLGSREKR